MLIMAIKSSIHVEYFYLIFYMKHIKIDYLFVRKETMSLRTQNIERGNFLGCT